MAMYGLTYVVMPEGPMKRAFSVSIQEGERELEREGEGGRNGRRS